MAKLAGYAFCGFLVVLAAFAQFGMAAQVGSIHISNDADGSLTMHNTVNYADGHKVEDPSYSPLPKGNQYLFQVEDGMDNIFTSYIWTTTSGTQFNTLILDWSAKFGGVVDCMPDCFWVVDNLGLSMAPSDHAPLKRVWSWRSR